MLERALPMEEVSLGRQPQPLLVCHMALGPCRPGISLMLEGCRLRSLCSAGSCSPEFLRLSPRHHMG